MKVYLTILVLILAVGGAQLVRNALSDTEADFVAAYPVGHPLHGREGEVVAAVRAEYAREERERVAAERTLAAVRVDWLGVARKVWHSRPPIILAPGVHIPAE